MPQARTAPGWQSLASIGHVGDVIGNAVRKRRELEDCEAALSLCWSLCEPCPVDGRDPRTRTISGDCWSGEWSNIDFEQDRQLLFLPSLSLPSLIRTGRE
jgi:hypothetical protein